MQRTYNQYDPRAIPGLLHGLGDAKIEKFCNSTGIESDTWEIAIPATPTSSTEYQVTADGITIKFTTGSNATQAELESGLFAAMRTNAVFTTKAEALLNSPQHTISVIARIPNTAISVTANPSTLTVTHVSNTLLPLITIPFGRIVGRKPNYLYDQASLVTELTDSVIGVTLSTHAVAQMERYIPTNATYGLKTDVGYKPLDVMNVVMRTSELTGIYVETIENDITLFDRPYVSITPGHEGKVTKSPSGTIPIHSFAKFERPSQTELGYNLILLSISN